MPGIIATIWPATQSPERLKFLYENWVRILRFNCSHATHQWMTEVLANAREVERMVWNRFAFLLDTKWPWIRTWELSNPVSYQKWEEIKIVVDKNLVDDDKVMYIDYPHVISDLDVWKLIRIESWLLDIIVTKKWKNYLIWTAENDAEITSKRHVNLPWVPIRLPWLTDKDRDDILFAIEHNMSYVALSFARKWEDLQELKEFLYKNGWAHLKVIAKIENQEWIDNIASIIRNADAIMVARWDLWAEVPVETIPSHQINLIDKTKRKWKKVIVATQMLESMITNHFPTRAEVSDIFYAVSQWADYLMLSGETSMWKYPISCVKVMNKIINEAEKYI
jgi:pyruvate kinase